MNLLSPQIGTIFWTALTFLLLLFILRRMAWNPILQTMAEREKRIKEALDKADAAQKESEETMVKQKEIIESAKHEAQELLGKSKKTAETTKEEILQKANSEAENILERAKKEISLEKEKAVEEIKSSAAELSIMIASKIVGKSLSPKDHQDVIKESIQKMSEAH